MVLKKIKKIQQMWVQPLQLAPISNEYSEQTNEKRNDIFDALKGIAIFLVIIGHSKEASPLWSFIYTFHMPLFFFVAGFFLKIRPIRKEISLSVKRLIIPYIFTAVCICVAILFKGLSSDSWIDELYIQGTILKFLLGYRGEYTPSWIIGHVGILWFILAMFWGRLVVVFLIQKIKSVKVLCCLFVFLGILGIILEKTFFVPYCIPQGLFAAGYIYTGYLIHKYNLLSIRNMRLFYPALLLSWLYSWTQGTLGMVFCDAPVGYIFCLVGALGAVLTLYITVSQLYQNDSLLWRVLLWGGRYSLIIYSIHAIEMDTCNWGYFAVQHNLPLEHFGAFELLIRFIIVFVFTPIVLKLRPLREEIFQIRRM